MHKDWRFRGTKNYYILFMYHHISGLDDGPWVDIHDFPQFRQIPKRCYKHDIKSYHIIHRQKDDEQNYKYTKQNLTWESMQNKFKHVEMKFICIEDRHFENMLINNLIFKRDNRSRKESLIKQLFNEKHNETPRCEQMEWNDVHLWTVSQLWRFYQLHNSFPPSKHFIKDPNITDMLSVIYSEDLRLYEEASQMSKK
ncbi:MAG: hypothetical protein EBV19_05755 [Flavobacteriia bacterium]|nr:hypothetical protein [Flavobacteriia bacterium]